MNQFVLLKLEKEYLRSEAEFFLNNFKDVNGLENGEVINSDDYFVRLYELLEANTNVFILPFGLYANKKMSYDPCTTTHFGKDFAYIIAKEALEVKEDSSQLVEDINKYPEFSNYLFTSPLEHLEEYNEYTYSVKKNYDLTVYLKYIKKNVDLANISYNIAKEFNEYQVNRHEVIKHKQSNLKLKIKRVIDLFRRKKQRVYLNKSFNNKLILIGRSEIVNNNSLINLDGKIRPLLQKTFNHLYIVIFDYCELDKYDGVAYRLMSKNGDDNLQIKNRKYNEYYNYNHIRAISRNDKYLYYTRNTAKGNVLVQKKVRYYFENKGFNYRVYAGLILSLFTKANLIFFEKNIGKFDASAKAVFDQVNIDRKYIALMKDSEDYPKIKTQYQNQVIEPGSVRYYQILFAAKYAIGTEITSHLATLRTPNKLLRTHLQKKKLIFLQHGIMMAISLQTAERAFFRRDGYYNIDKFVVSSSAEAEHVKQLGFYDEENIWNTGLANFDGRNQEEVNKEYITIMHTWRPYEESSQEINKTTYYQDVMDIYNSLYPIYGDQVKIIWHPKMSEYMTIDNDETISEIISRTKVLITDYSSVAFDAFYRGANVIFDWRHKEEIMTKLNTHIMYNRSMAFGDVIYDLDELITITNRNYNNMQSQINQDKYTFFNEHNDNLNTKRICNNIENLFN